MKKLSLRKPIVNKLGKKAIIHMRSEYHHEAFESFVHIAYCVCKNTTFKATAFVNLVHPLVTIIVNKQVLGKKAVIKMRRLEYHHDLFASYMHIAYCLCKQIIFKTTAFFNLEHLFSCKVLF